MTRYKIFNAIFIVVFFLALLVVPAFWIARQGNWERVSEVEGRNLVVFPAIPWREFPNDLYRLLNRETLDESETIFQSLFDGSFRNDVETAGVDQFPYRLSVVAAARAIERIQIHTAYAPLQDVAIPASLDTEYLIMRHEPVFIQEPVPNGYVSQNTIDARIRNYQELISAHPDMRFFVFYLERMAFAPYNPAKDRFPESDSGSSYQYFLENKPVRLYLSDLRLKNYEEHKEYFFKTDHHWNSRGAWEGYSLIYDMLADQFPEISPKLELEAFKVIKGADFCGSYARRTLVPCTPEPFEVALVDVPPYQTIIDGQVQPYGHREEYLAGSFEKERYTNHYAAYYGNVIDLVEYRFENSSPRNLLLLGNSYSQAAQLLIASHYRTTYVIDFRDYSEFDLSEFLAAHPVDDVLILGDVIVYGSESWLIRP